MRDLKKNSFNDRAATSLEAKKALLAKMKVKPTVTAPVVPDRALLTDPQTSGGLLVACAPEAVDEVLAVFRRQGFGQAAVIGGVAPRGTRPLAVR